MSGSFKQISAYVALLAIGAGAGVAGSRYWESQLQPSAPDATPVVMRPSTPLAVPGTKSSDPNFIARAVEKVGPAVVRIDASRTVSPDVPDNPFLRRFFGDEIPVPQERVERGTGSGFIFAEDGRIITNAHVVEGADTVEVKLKDGRTFEGRVAGTDPLTDIAVVKIEATDLPVAPLGGSSDLVPGEWAIAIGNPMGLDNTVTVGIISATGRSSAQVGINDKRVRFIQTDAAINPGNSGGPLLDDKGEVIGINTAIRANAQGLGFAIPIETALRIADSLFSEGRVEHPFLGIQMVDLNAAVKEQLSEQFPGNRAIDRETGVLIVDIVPNSPAQSAGLEAGDVIVEIDGEAIDNATQVQEIVEASEVGATLEVTVDRDGKEQTLSVRPGAFPTR